jgi:V/A-type H+-transporting ATPase subunit I
VSKGLLATLLGVAALAIIGAEPLARLIEGEHPVAEDGLGTALIQGFFELFETTIGFLSNTLSYVRMGAFAVAHGGLSLVVFMLARIVDPSQGVWYWLVFLLGNLFVIGFEGMIVGIQTLRLEYYEFFSRFFSGSGLRHRPLTLIAKEES